MPKLGISALFAGGVVVLAGVTSIGVFDTQAKEHFARVQDAVTETVTEPFVPRVRHMPEPEAVKAIYMSQCAASTESFRESLLKIVDETEVNAIVVDLKDYSGTIAFPSETAVPGGVGCTVSDFEKFVDRLHDHDVYVIGRMTVFQDPLYTKTYPQWSVKKKSDTTQTWRDHKGLAFVDVGAKPFWDYIITLSKEAHNMGVDEINFDYIRFPSDGNMLDVHYQHATGNKQDELEKFFKYLSENFKMEDGGHVPMMSADLFGMTTTNSDDLSIGQVLERALPYFDYIAPMVYPSHYPPGFIGLGNPNDHVYEVVNYSLDQAVPRVVASTTKQFSYAYERMGTSTPAVYKKPVYKKTALRPWLQDFDYGGNYGPAEVRAQIQATYDAGLTSWMLWDPANRYTPSALEAKRVGTTTSENSSGQ